MGSGVLHEEGKVHAVGWELKEVSIDEIMKEMRGKGFKMRLQR